MSEQGPIRKLADDLTALAGPDGGVAYIYHHDEYSAEIVADQAGLLYLAAALAQTAALAEAEPDAKQTGPFTDSVFKEGSDSRIGVDPVRWTV